MKLVYDFSGFYEIFQSIKCCDSNIVPLKTTDNLRKELDKFFKDAKCKEVIYTVNTDKQFFGIKVFASFDKWYIYDALMSDNPYKIEEYSVEIDSKLLTGSINGLDEKEATALLIKEVNAVIGDNTSIQKARDYLAMYLALNKTTLKISNHANYRDILSFGVKDYMSKCNSITYMLKEDMVLEDELSRAYGIHEYLESAFNKICLMKPYEDNEQNIGIVFSWILRLYGSVANRRIGSIKTLKTCKELTGSRLEKREFDNLIKSVERLDDSSLLQESLGPIGAKMLKMRIKTIKSMDDDYYEIAMQVRNVEDEDDALYIIRQINSRMSILSDYIDEGKLPEKDKQNCMKIYDKYNKLRDELARTQTYKRSTTAIYVNYPEIRDCRS